MTKQEKIDEKEIRLVSLKEQEKELLSGIEKLKNKSEMGDDELRSEFYKAMAGQVSVFRITIKSENFEHILGGDGRSAPWSEIRKGEVAYIECESYIDVYHYNEKGSKKVSVLIQSTLKSEGIDKVVFK
jgi:hypothetical protein